MLAQLITQTPDPSVVGAGRIAFIIVGLLAVALVLLYLSMRRHINRVPASFDPAPSSDEASAAEPANGEQLS